MYSVHCTLYSYIARRRHVLPPAVPYRYLATCIDIHVCLLTISELFRLKATVFTHDRNLT